MGVEAIPSATDANRPQASRGDMKRQGMRPGDWCRGGSPGGAVYAESRLASFGGDVE